jgi:hypothetical protein
MKNPEEKAIDARDEIVAAAKKELYSTPVIPGMNRARRRKIEAWRQKEIKVRMRKATIKLAKEMRRGNEKTEN